MKIIEIEGTRNCRDLGGTIGAGGKVILPKKFIRGIRIYEIDEFVFLQMAKEYKIKTIIELRNEYELLEAPDPDFEHINRIKFNILRKHIRQLDVFSHINFKSLASADSISTYNFSIMDDKLRGIDRTKPFSMKEFLLNHPSMEEIYRRILIDSQSQQAFRNVLDLLFSEHEGSIYFHCSEGKDRTGLVSMFVQEILGVSREAIYEDYLLTNKYPTPRLIEFQEIITKITDDPKIIKKVEDLFVVKESYLDAAYKTIESVYGSIKNYLAEILNFDDSRIADCRARFLK